MENPEEVGGKEGRSVPSVWARGLEKNEHCPGEEDLEEADPGEQGKS